MKLIQINTTANWGSTGKIAEDIGKIALENGWESWIAYGRGKPKSESNLIRIGNDFDMHFHGIQSRLFDNHGIASKKVTRQFISQIKNISPDIIHLHNIHGYYLNYPILFDYLKSWGGPVIWTLHDCWTFTGHCAYYDYIKCDKWQTKCYECPQQRSYPASFWKDRSQANYFDKKKSFLGCPNLTFVPVSNWLKRELSKSFLSEYNAITIHNGIDINLFHPIHNIHSYSDKKIILGVASVWDKRKGLDEFIKLRKILSNDYEIILVGLSERQITTLPKGIKGLKRTESVEQLVSLYNRANVFVNPTLEDNFPTTNLEALACGTPVITYNTGGSPEAIDAETGAAVNYQDIDLLATKIKEFCKSSSSTISQKCRNRALILYDKNIVFRKYIRLYNDILRNV